MKLHLILGPTGVGKTDRSVLSAQRLRAPVISLDRFQIFEELAMGTARPAPHELLGTERLYLADGRSVDEGELPARDALARLERLLDVLGPKDVILEGGSISLSTLVFQSRLLGRHSYEVDYIAPPDRSAYEQRIRRRVRTMLAPPDGQPSLFDELAPFWDSPELLAFVESICGYDALSAWCRRRGVTPGDVQRGEVDDDAITAVTEAHLDYAERQCQLFDALLQGNKRPIRTSEMAPPLEPPDDVRPVAAGLDGANPAQLADPYAIFARLRREAPITYSESIGAWLVAKLDDVVTVLKDPERFSSVGAIKVKPKASPEVQDILSRGLLYVPTLLDNDPPAHARFRGLVNKAFAPQRVQALEATVHSTADTLIDRFIANGRVDVMEEFAFPLPIHVIATIVGVPHADVGDLKLWCDDWMSLQSGTKSVDELVSCAKNYLRMQEYFAEKVEDRTRAPEDDLISALILARIEDQAPLSRNELVRLLMSLFVAGHETTTHAIGNTLALLLQNPSQLALLRGDPQLAADCFEEGVRMDPPIQSIFRRATADVVLGGVAIPAGDRLMLLYGSANRDEAHFDAPDEFLIERVGSVKHLGFGRGIHFCLGAAMARLEGRVALERILRRLPALELDVAEPVERVEHFFLRGYKRLLVKWPVADRRRSGCLPRTDLAASVEGERSSAGGRSRQAG